MKYAIGNTCGQWWTGTCWGVEQAREEYCVSELPPEIDGLELDVDQMLYLGTDEYDGASIRRVRGYEEDGWGAE